MNIRVILADDHPLIVFAARQCLTQATGFVVVGEAHNPKTLLEVMERCPCDVLVTDFAMPRAPRQDGLVMLNAVRTNFPEVRIVVLTMLENAGLFKDMLGAGVFGILNKRDSIAELPGAILAAFQRRRTLGPLVHREIASSDRERSEKANGRTLSPRESEVLRLYVSGMTTSEVARHLHRSINTISTQKTSAMRKLGLSNDSELYDYAVRSGLRG